jgi:hypothetical protein
MTWRRKPRSKVLTPDEWRQHLTDDEADTIRGLDARTTKIDAERAEIAAIRNPIQNRAIQRAKYAKKATTYHRRMAAMGPPQPDQSRAGRLR